MAGRAHRHLGHADPRGVLMKSADEEDYLIFRVRGGSLPMPQPKTELNGLRFSIWEPNRFSLKPPGQAAYFVAWWGLHESRVFKNRNYSVLIVRDGDRVVHRTCVMPAWFRWPFMSPEDIQISDTWTDVDYRGRGIAAAAAGLVVARSAPEQYVWYSTQVSNEPSLAVCRSVGMDQVGRAMRTHRLGLRLLGSLEVQ
jgi:RimJ/RimL family protein N-acetyltransferase